MAKKRTSGSGNTAEIVRKLAQPIAEEFGVLLWDVRFVKEGADWYLRVFIDRDDQPVSIDDCVSVSRKLSDVLDEKDPISQSYCLEVSSPGIERELTRPEHFEMFAGAAVVVRLYQAIDGEKEFAGILQGLTDEGILVLEDIDQQELRFDRKEIANVHVLEEEYEDTSDTE